MVKKSAFDAVEDFQRTAVALMMIAWSWERRDYLIVYNPYANYTIMNPNPEVLRYSGKVARFNKEIATLRKMAGDPEERRSYYNPNLTEEQIFLWKESEDEII